MAAAPPQSVEFPYYAYPRQFWERELVWLKNIGIHTVALPVPGDGQPGPNTPRGDLEALLRMLRRLDMHAWIEGQSISPALEASRQAHGGPLEDAPPQWISVPAPDRAGLVKSRDALANGGLPLVWTDVEDTLSPAFHKGAISFSGEELPSIGALRRSAALLQYWESLLPAAESAAVQPVTGRFPDEIRAHQLTFSNGASAVSLVNASNGGWSGDLRVFYAPLKRKMVLPGVQLPAGEALWLPVGIPLADGPLCRDCGALVHDDQIVYATAELTRVEYENGILAMEFCAPTPGEVVLQLSREPSGPLLAAAKPTSFDWDEKTSRARLPIPAGKGPAHRVRIGLAIEPPEASAFFADNKPLIIGQRNRVATSYSSEDLAKRAMLRVPAGYRAEPERKSPNEVDYWVTVPPDAAHGDHVELVIEADGMRMGHSRLQLLRPVSLRFREAVALHYGTAAELPVTPPLISVDQRAGRNLSLLIRNNSPEIRNFVIEMAGNGLEFSPARIEISVGASMERDASIRVFAPEASAGLHPALVKVSGAAPLEMPVNILVIPPGQTVRYSLDLDEDGAPESVLETQKARAVFSRTDGGRWLEFVWKDSGTNVLPAEGVELGPVAIDLAGSELTVDGTADLPTRNLQAGKHGDVLLAIEHPRPSRAIYKLSR